MDRRELNTGSADADGTDIAVIDPPKGGGALKGVDESHSVNPVNGTSSLTVAIPVGAGRAGFAPNLSLDYGSGRGNGPFGLGWELSLATIRRRTERELPRYHDATDSDTYVLGGAEDLVPALADQGAGGWQPVRRDTPDFEVALYRPRIEGLWHRIERWRRKSDGDIHWRTINGDNVTTIFGLTAASRVADPDDPMRVFEWKVSRVYDDKGNLAVYDYIAEDLRGVGDDIWERQRIGRVPANSYLKRIRHGVKSPWVRGSAIPADDAFAFEVVFDFGDHDPASPTPTPDRDWTLRPDPFSNYRAGFERRVYRLCRRVLLFHRFDELPINPCLVSALEFDHSTEADSTAAGRSMASTSYLRGITQRGYIFDAAAGAYTSKATPPLIMSYQPLVWSNEVRTVTDSFGEDLPASIADGRTLFYDLHSEGSSGFLHETDGALHFRANEGGGRFAPDRPVDPAPSFSGIRRGALALRDVGGTGDSALVQIASAPHGFFRRSDTEGWLPFEAFEATLTRSLTDDPNARMVDLNGDGVPDLLVTLDEVFEWHENLGEAGFGPANRLAKAADDAEGPRVVFSDAAQRIFLADMSGDGLSDILRITNGDVCYWPNLGFGRFGRKVVMGAAPRFANSDAFDPERIRLLDVDGTGTTDIAYLGESDIRIWLNLSGNRLSEPRVMDTLPPGAGGGQISVADINGSGLPCLVWRSPANRDAGRNLRYVELAGGRKPHLLTTYDNNSGRVVRLDYRTSTDYYREDRRAGRPWALPLPFPVYVVSRSVSHDLISGQMFTTLYRYRHGTYDGREREFRGFGCVETVDTESFTEFSTSGASNVVEERLHQPPVRTLRWYHTGLVLQRALLDSIYAAEYYANPATSEMRPAPTRLPADTPTSEWREALRALRGSLLREEVYSDDNTVQAPHPYSVSEASYTVSRVQPRHANRPGSFLVTANERISTTYDRVPEDPRIVQSLVLETDDLGNALLSAEAVYPRRTDPPGRPPSVVAAQQERHITVGRVALTSDIDVADDYRLRASFEAMTHEVLGLAVAPATQITRADLLHHLATAAEIGFEAAGSGAPELRLTGHTRSYFLRDDLTGPLPLGQRQTRGLAHRSMGLAMTPAMIAADYGAEITDAMLLAAGYVHSEGDANWWVPGPTNEYHPNPQTTFFTVAARRDAMGGLSRVSHDRYWLLPEVRTDALGNTEAAVNDYRTLSPHTVIDVNGNRTATAFDELGLVTAVAVMGKPGAGEGDTLENPTARSEYDLTRWMTHAEPTFARVFRRTENGPDPRWLEQISYFDGSGRVVMTKSRTDPGPALRVNTVTGLTEEVQADPRWVGNGRTVFDNKGQPLRQFEPYFSVTDAYETEAALVETGVSSVLTYDAAGRVVRTDFPNGTFAGVTFDAWSYAAFDPNDTVRDSDWYAAHGAPDPNTQPEPADPATRAAWLAARHHDTPYRVNLDTLGRPILSQTDYGGGHAPQARSEMDARGRAARVFDELDREISFGVVNMAGAPTFGRSAERGENRVFKDVLGRLVRSWNGAGQSYRSSYDVLGRPVAAFVTERGAERLVHRIIYGDALADAAERNLRGQVHRIYDQAGLTTIDRIDFRGNVISVSRQLTAAFDTDPDWAGLEGLDNADAFAAAAPALSAEVFRLTASFDAMGRMQETTLEDGTRQRAHYTEAGGLDRLEVQVLGQGPFIEVMRGQTFNARGQRLSVTFGNGHVSSYVYDPLTFRLASSATTQAGGAIVQDLRYTYDPAGNVVAIDDAAQTDVFFANGVVTPERRFEYDAAYRLIRATGREHAAAQQPTEGSASPVGIIPQPNSLTALRTYTEVYDYDDVGNITRLRHIVGTGPGWTRHFRYARDLNPSDRTNRLVAVSQPGDAPGGPFGATYTHDSAGNITSMPHLATMAWDFAQRLRSADLGGGGMAFYVYGISGGRRRKVVRRQGGARTERLYLGATEIYREFSAAGVLQLERRTVHVSGPGGRIAQVDIKTVDATNADPQNPLGQPVWRYQLGDHLGSSSVETDATGQVISYEEYHPFGTTAYRAARPGANLSLKRYRFAGKERDDETGLIYFGARYLAPWLCRWISCDPAGFSRGANLFAYCSNNPISLHDPNGAQDERTFSVGYGNKSHLLEVNTTEARSELDRHMAGRTRTEPDGTVLRFRPDSHFWSESRGQNVGYWDPVTPGGGDGASADGPADDGPTLRNPSPGTQEAIRGQSANRANSGLSTTLRNNPGGTPRSFTPGQSLIEEPANLWSGGVDWASGRSITPGSGADNAMRAPGYIMEDTILEEAAESFARSRGYGSRFDVPFSLDPASDFQQTWSGTSERFARNIGLSQSTVTSNGISSNPSGVQATVEIPTIQLFGGLMAQAGKVSGVLTIVAASGVDNDYVRWIAYGAGATEFAAGNSYLLGSAALGSDYFAASTVSRMMTFGRVGGRLGGGVGVITLSGYSGYVHIQQGEYGALPSDAGGVYTGVAVLAGSGPHAAIGLGVVATNMIGDGVESVVTPRTNRTVGVAAGTAAGAAAGAAIGAAIGVWGFGVGAAPAAAVGAVVGGIAGFIGSYF
jgi:RHS repeat-associated protein